MCSFGTFAFNPLSPGGMFMVQKMAITSPIPVLVVKKFKLCMQDTL